MSQIRRELPGAVFAIETVSGFRREPGRAIGGAAHITHSSVAGSLVEIMAVGVDKGAALSTVVANLGLAATSVIAFGDMPNDIEMLTWAGRGYAVDGVARVLEQLLESPAFA